MKKFFPSIFVLFLLVAVGCKQKEATEKTITATNSIRYADGFELYEYKNFSVLKVTRPWPGATENLTYILKKNAVAIPDSLSKFPTISVPIKSVLVTSTTHLPALEILDELTALKGFPGLDYISSDLVRAKIEAGSIREIGKNETLNTEIVLDVDPDVLVAFGMDGNNQVLNTLEKSGIQVVYNGDWAEQTPLGKAEWIKFFGALFNKGDVAERTFTTIENNYKETLEKISTAKTKPTVVSGAMYQDVWYLPQGQSWAAVFFNDAQADYLWKSSEGTGSLSLSFEAVYDRAKNADFWINPAQFETLAQLKKANPHYANFEAFKNKEVYSFVGKKGKTGGVLFYELGPTRPDLVLKDLISIIHPEIFPDYQRTFYERLQ
ncbi:ABC transporter substrate-binding protein [Flavobacterium sp. NKUCC04_CG]|uniref:ABC transporter substrate-binding protein n=1 Tax=Flavobacterium sp. NKUCC04_CG TaxID=2842121 RepID=UPI001C5B5AF2|nr:ABC transporter substrate-binding protein [Flavobacterium sp. NKUCC04_CG]MBW3519609.1 ABC transporter substrate-binding protein [Flavobacterium sp. NKUCC04_CG]